ncbi:putative chromate transport protein [Variibacter gotjawalensis]|uniref:Putative chromate transport protein n=1 Tax=Variibacter gotjawalensis TaxID=1333996 RepID=A0A0S3PRC8_9BRAD|nr:chromate transporter [Variibacter gotjawalensis]RZS50598.1 chromate transporter [Variibacter gotjawalensis]BAT58432.1 putative chromate transport protein [Variibacter gotjawalensis]
MEQPANTQPPTLAQATKVWARIGCLSFGGPAGQIALMHRELVEERHWIGEQRFLHALNYCMLLPGPEAQQLAVYIGWLMHRTIGGLIAGLLFVIPGALVMLALSTLYVFYRSLPLVDAAFFGIKAAVLAIVVEAVMRIGKRALKSRAMIALAAGAFVALYVFRVPFPLVILAAGLLGWLFPDVFSNAKSKESIAPEQNGIIDAMFARGELTHAEPSWRRALTVLAVWLPLWLGPVVLIHAILGRASVFTEIGAFFSLMAVVTFGGAYAVLAYVAQAAVETFGWLNAGEMIDGLGLAETTPGPLILVLQHVGFLAAYRAPGALSPLAAGALGALLTTWVTFAPCFLWIFLGAPYVETLRNHRATAAALSAITAAVVGVILNLAVWFALHVVFRKVEPLNVFGLTPDWPVFASIDWRAAVLAAAAIIAVLYFRLGMIPALVLFALAGIALSAL